MPSIQMWHGSVQSLTSDKHPAFQKVFIPPQKGVLGEYSVFSMSVIPKFRHSVNI